MYDSQSKGISYTAGFVILILFTLAGVIFAAFISAPVWEYMTGKPLKDMADGVFEASDSAAYKVLQAIQQIFGYFIPTLVTAAVLSRKPYRLIGFVPGFRANLVLLAILIMLVSLIASGGLSYINHAIPIPDNWKLKFERWESDYMQQVEAIVNLKTGIDFLIALLVMAVLPAICEETLFRGGLQNFLTRATGHPVLSIIVVSLIFSAVHFSYYGFLSRLFLGMILGFLYLFSGKMWPNILAHFLNNAIALTAVYISSLQGRRISETMNEAETGWLGLLALPIVIILMRVFERKSANNYTRYQ